LPSSAGAAASLASDGAASVRLRPSGVSSSAQPSTSASGKPSTISAITKLMPQSGTPMRGNMISAACNTAKAVAA
jgi:hypothetical protein